MHDHRQPRNRLDVALEAAGPWAPGADLELPTKMIRGADAQTQGLDDRPSQRSLVEMLDAVEHDVPAA